MNFMDTLFGTSGGMQKESLLNPQQEGLNQQLLGGLGQPTGSGLEWLNMLMSQDPQAMQQFQAPMMRQFEQQTVPMIAERFAGMGSHGASSSSAMQQTMGQAGKELSESLGALRGNIGMQAMSQLQSLLGQSMRPTFENIYMQPTKGILGGAAEGFGEGLGKVAGAAMF